MTPVLALALIQDSIAWRATFKDACEEAVRARKLVMLSVGDPADPLTKKVSTDVMTAPIVAKVAEKFVPVAADMSKDLSLSHRYKSPGRPVIYFVDGEGAVRGHVFGPLEPSLFVRLAEAIDDVWRRHDALEFRAKGRPTDTDRAKLGFSFAMRLDRDRAMGNLAEISTRFRFSELELAWTALAQAEMIAGRSDRSVEAWLKLESLTRDPLLKSAARLGAGMAWKTDRPKEAMAKFKLVASSPDTAAIDRWIAETLLAQMESH